MLMSIIKSQMPHNSMNFIQCKKVQKGIVFLSVRYSTKTSFHSFSGMCTDWVLSTNLAVHLHSRYQSLPAEDAKRRTQMARMFHLNSHHLRLPAEGAKRRPLVMRIAQLYSFTSFHTSFMYSVSEGTG